MKKWVLVLLAMAGISAAKAQPHSVLVYGSASFDQNTINGSGQSNTTLNSTWSVMPGIGYQFNQHLTVGIQGGYSKAPYIGETYFVSPYGYGYGVPDVNLTKWNAGVFGRYTQWLGSVFFIYGQVNMAYAAVSNDAPAGFTLYPTGNSTDNYINDADGFQTSIFPGIGVNVYRGFALNVSIGGIDYTSLSQKDGSYTVNHFNISFGQEVNIGVSKNFGGHFRHRRHHHSMEPGMELRHIDVSDDDDDDDAPPPPPVHKKESKHHEE